MTKVSHVELSGFTAWQAETASDALLMQALGYYGAKYRRALASTDGRTARHMGRYARIVAACTTEARRRGYA
jgi:hypothetical protein